MRKASTFSRNPANRIDEEAENFDDTSSSDDELLPAPVPAKGLHSRGASANLYDAELKSSAGAGGGSDGEDVDEEMDETLLGEDVIAGGADADREAMIRERVERSREQMKHILELFDEDQLRRYETFRRVFFSKSGLKKLMVRVLDQQVTPNSMIVVGGIAKVFVGELVEEARKLMEDLGETGPILPSHLLEAQRRLKAAGLAGTSSIYKRPKNRLL